MSTTNAKAKRHAFSFDPGVPNLGELRDVAAMHPVNAALAVASLAARKLWVEARVARYGPIVKPTLDEMWEQRWFE